MIARRLVKQNIIRIGVVVIVGRRIGYIELNVRGRESLEYEEFEYKQQKNVINTREQRHWDWRLCNEEEEEQQHRLN